MQRRKEDLAKKARLGNIFSKKQRRKRE